MKKLVIVWKSGNIEDRSITGEQINGLVEAIKMGSSAFLMALKALVDNIDGVKEFWIEGIEEADDFFSSPEFPDN